MFNVKPIYFQRKNLSNCRETDKEYIKRFNSITKNNQIIEPYQYQIDILKKIEEYVNTGKNAVIIIRNPTCSGKSLAGQSASLIGYKKGGVTMRSVYMYPTKELVREQRTNFSEYLINNQPHDLSCELIDANRIQELQKEWIKYGKKVSKSTIVSDIYANNPAIFTTIDNFYNALSFIYKTHDSRNTIETHFMVTVPDVYFIDEFDAYDIKQQSSIEWIICLLCHKNLMEQRGEGKGKIVILSSATPNSQMIERLRHTGIEVIDDFVEPFVDIKTNNAIQILPEVNIHLFQASNKKKEYKNLTYLSDIFEYTTIYNLICERYKNTSLTQIVLIGDSVYDCIKVGNQLKNDGYEVGEIHGLSAIKNSERENERNKRVIIGNHSIDLGIDFTCDTLIMTAMNTSQFIQRIGRLRGSRIRCCECIMILPQKVFVALKNKFTLQSIERKELYDYVYENAKNIFNDQNVYSEYQQMYAPIEFLNVIEKRYEQSIILTLKQKETIDNTLNELFNILYQKPIQTYIERKKKLNNLFADNKDDFEKILMRFRSNSLCQCIVYDTTAKYEYHIYNLEYLIRYANIDFDNSNILDGKDVRESKNQNLIQFYEENKSILGNKIVYVQINGYEKKSLNIQYEIVINNKINKKNEGCLFTDKGWKKICLCAENPIFVNKIKYVIKGMDDIYMDGLNKFVSKINDLIRTKNILLYYIRENIPNGLENEWYNYIDKQINLTIFDQPLYSLIEINDERYNAIVGFNLHALHLHCICRSIYKKSRLKN